MASVGRTVARTSNPIAFRFADKFHKTLRLQIVQNGASKVRADFGAHVPKSGGSNNVFLPSSVASRTTGVKLGHRPENMLTAFRDNSTST